MKEQLITFDTGKLAKEKEFDIEVRNYYKEGFPKNLMNHQVDCNFNRYVKLCVSVPTQSLLQKWLRETHNIFISIDVNYCYKIYNNDELYVLGSLSKVDCNNYEQVLEKGLQEGLKLIK